jgi:hypothetical protein
MRITPIRRLATKTTKQNLLHSNRPRGSFF